MVWHHALARQGGATPQRHSVQCSDDQRNRSAWGVTRKGGRTVDRQDRASRSRGRGRPRTWHPQPSRGRNARAPGTHSRRAGRDARAPGTHSRHAGATPAHLAPHIRASSSYAGGDARAPGIHIRASSGYADGDARAPGTHIARLICQAGGDTRAPGRYTVFVPALANATNVDTIGANVEEFSLAAQTPVPASARSSSGSTTPDRRDPALAPLAKSNAFF